MGLPQKSDVNCPKCGAQMYLMGSGTNYGCVDCQYLMSAYDAPGSIERVFDRVNNMIDDFYGK